MTNPALRHPHLIMGLSAFRDSRALYLVQVCDLKPDSYSSWAIPGVAHVRYRGRVGSRTAHRRTAAARDAEMPSLSVRAFPQQEHAKRGDLFEVAARFPHRQLPEKDVVSKILLPISKAVAFLHSKGIIHRDIKPENVVVMTGASSKQLVICSFVSFV